MKARTKNEKLVMELHGKLPPLSRAQREWAEKECFERIGYVLKGLVWCTHCGREFRKDGSELGISLGVGDEAICPCCGAKLKLVVNRRKKIDDSEYFAVVTTIGGWQVVRNYIIERVMYRVTEHIHSCHEPIYEVHEVVQNWMNERGEEVIVARSRRAMFSVYCDKWDYRKPMSVKKRSSYGYYPDAHNIRTWNVYPRKHVIPIVKRNGYGGERIPGCTMAELFGMLIRNPQAEILIKNKQYGLLGMLNRRGKLWNWHAVKIAIRNRYRIKADEATLWMDMLDCLEYFGKDTHNAHYVCPDDIKAAHDYWMMKKRKAEAEKEKKRKAKEALRWEEEYKRMKERFFGLKMDNGRIVIEVIKSVAEMKTEGEEMHHCVMSMEYYKKEKSLIMSAKDQQQNRLETIEVDLGTMKVVQCYGKYNSITADHDDILALVEKNMGLIRQLAG